MISYLQNIWNNLTSTYTTNIQLTNTLFNNIVNSYTQKHRAYHTLEHIAQICLFIEPYKTFCHDIDLLIFAIFYHDVVYNTRQSDNEEQSAEYALRALQQLGLDKTKILTVQEMIMATKHHLKYNRNDFDTNLLLDSDLSILGADTLTYMAYSQQIRHEYKFVPWFLYRKKRGEVLQNFLQHEHIFKIEFIATLYQAQAHINIKTELEMLSN